MRMVGIAATATIAATVGGAPASPGYGALIALLGIAAVACWIVLRRRH